MIKKFYIKYLKLVNFYLVMEIFKDKNKDIFLMQIDNFTTNQFKMIFKRKPFKSKKELVYEYVYGGLNSDNLKNEFYFYVIVTSGKKREKVKLKCSELFYKNMLWIIKIDSFEEYYKYLKKDIDDT